MKPLTSGSPREIAEAIGLITKKKNSLDGFYLQQNIFFFRKTWQNNRVFPSFFFFSVGFLGGELWSTRYMQFFTLCDEDSDGRICYEEREDR